MTSEVVTNMMIGISIGMIWLFCGFFCANLTLKHWDEATEGQRPGPMVKEIMIFIIIILGPIFMVDYIWSHLTWRK